MERNNRIFPNTLRLHRKTQGYTQRQVAHLLGLHDSVPVSLWESGLKLPSTDNLIKLSLLYRTYPNELYSEVFRQHREMIKAKEMELFRSS